MERERKSREYWEDQLSEYWDGGLSIGEYCELKDLQRESARRWISPTSALYDQFEGNVAQQSFRIYFLKRCFFTGSRRGLMPRVERMNRCRSSGRPGRSHSLVETINVA